MNLYWNREEATTQRRSFASSSNDKPIVKKAKIVSLSNRDDPANAPLHTGTLPEGSSLLAIGCSIEDFDIPTLQQEQPNVLFVSHPQVGL